MTSKTYKLDIKDVAKGLLIAILTSGLDYLAQSLLLDDFSFKRVLLAGLSGGVAYIVNRFLSNEKGELLKHGG